MRLDVLGTRQDDCPVNECREIACFVPCEHTNIVYSKIPSRPFGTQVFLKDLLDATLSVQEDFIKKLCEPLDICEQGFRLGFPCVQCGLSEHELGESMLNLCGENCICISPIKSKEPTWIDLSSAQYIDIYTKMVEWIKCARGYANGEMISSFASIFDGEFLGFNNGIYSIKITNDPVLLAILPILHSITPVPFGASVQFLIEDCEV